MEPVIIGLAFVCLFFITVNFVGNFRKIKERGEHNQKVIDGFYTYKMALIGGFVDKDDSMPEEYRKLCVVRPWEPYMSFFISGDHIIDQEMYDKVAFYADTFSGVDFRAILKFEWESYRRHAEWKAEWVLERFIGSLYPQFSPEEHQERKVN